MKLVIDAERCAGHARCNAVGGANLLPLNDDGYIGITELDVPPGQEALARRGARACPERVITILDDPEAKG